MAEIQYLQFDTQVFRNLRSIFYGLSNRSVRWSTIMWYPVTLYPDSIINAAATALSTPPLNAIPTFIFNHPVNVSNLFW
jgi:hypothetical protein